jgi:hypothetical protein
MMDRIEEFVIFAELVILFILLLLLVILLLLILLLILRPPVLWRAKVKVSNTVKIHRHENFCLLLFRHNGLSGIYARDFSGLRYMYLFLRTFST